MPLRVTVIYNSPVDGRYNAAGEKAAVLGVIEAAEAVRNAACELGHDVALLPLLPPISSVRDTLASQDGDIIFNLFEGFDDNPRSEAEVAHIISNMGYKYTGCSSDVLSIAVDKAEVKSLLDKSGIPTPAYQVLGIDTLPEFHLDYPCIVKPLAEDASHGISEHSLVTGFSELHRQVSMLKDVYGDEALIEEYIEGREFNITVLGGRKPEVLPVTEIVYSLPDNLPAILTFSAKWNPESIYYQSTRPQCPAQIDPGLAGELTNYAVSICRLLQCTGYMRIDFRVDLQERPYIIDINPNPDISPSAGLAIQARASGLEYKYLIQKLIAQGMERNL